MEVLELENRQAGDRLVGSDPPPAPNSLRSAYI